MSEKDKIIFALAVLGAGMIGGFCGYKIGAYFVNIELRLVEVSVFSDGEQDGYSLAIPTSNVSNCVWTYSGGNAGVPYIKETTAKTANEKHVFKEDITNGLLYNFQVICVGDWGGVYKGVFPKIN